MNSKIRAVIDASNWQYFIKEAALELGLYNTDVYKLLEKHLFKENESDQLQKYVLLVKRSVELAIKKNMVIYEKED